MKSKNILFLLLIATGVVIVWLWSNPSAETSAPDRIELSYNLCLNFGEPAIVRQTDTVLRQRYLRKYWVDTTSQYYAKSIITPSEDTLQVSTFNKTSLQKVRQQIDSTGLAVLEQKRAKLDQTEYLLTFGRLDETYILRYLIPEPRFQTITMIDLVSKDSINLFHRYRDNFLEQQLQPCI